MKRLLNTAAVLAALLAAGCIFDTDRVAGGGSSETTNGVVAGLVRSPNGSPAGNARITLRPRSFLKDPGAFKAGMKGWIESAETYSDSLGRYAFDSVKAGDYYIESGDTGSLGSLIGFSADGGDTLVLETRMLVRTGTIQGRISSGASASGAYVQIYGLDRVERADSSGAFAFTDLPEGKYTLRAALAASQAEPRILPAVPAVPSETTDVGLITLSASFADEDYSAWPFSRRMILNTTSSGANITRDVSDFPVLVRLTAANFDFSKSDGKDIRFSDKAGKRLRYEVERWDTASKQAEVWVKVDTIHANSRADWLTMHWGRPGAPDWSDARQVFDTGSAFGGVWHMNEEAPGTTADGLYQDATPAAQHGDDRITNTGTTGIAGPGHGFTAGDHVRILPSASLRPTEYVYISAWFRGDTTDVSGATIAGLGDSYGLRVEADGNVRMFVHKGGTTWPLATTVGINVLDSSWHHLAGLFVGGSLTVYVDGVEKAKAAAAVTKIPYTLGTHFYIGRHGNGKQSYDLSGHLDEVMVVNRLRGVNFTKLCFESQRANPTLLEYDP